MNSSTDCGCETARQRCLRQRLCVAMVIMGIVLSISSAAMWWAARSVIRDIHEADGRYCWSKSGWLESFLPDWRQSSQRRQVGHVIATDANVTLVEVRGPHADDQLISRLSKLPDLSSVEVVGGSVTEVGLGELAKGSSIRSIELSDTPTFSDAGIAQLKSLPLSRLRIAGSAIHGSGIAELVSVRSLYVDRCARFSDASLAGLHRLKHLRFLVLSSTGITNAGMEHLVHFPELKQLHLDFSAVDDAGLVTLVRTCPQLESISLTGTAVTETGFSELAKFKHLKSVSIQAGAFSGSSLSALKAELPAVTIHER